MVRKLVFGESNYFNVKLDDERGGGNGKKIKNEIGRTWWALQCRCDKVTATATK